MKILPIVLFMLVLQALWAPVLAQDKIVVTGTVNAKTGEPLIGATVSVKGSGIAVTSGAGGNFSINVPNRNVHLVISYVCMAPQEVSIPESGPLAVLMEDVTPGGLDEVVVVGYGTQAK